MTRHTGQGQRGVTLVLFALLMVSLLTLVAFAVDLGFARFDKRDTQATADLAGLAAGYFLAGNGADTAASHPRLACAAAIQSVETNTADFPTVTNAAAQCALYFPDLATTCIESNLPPASLRLAQGRYLLAIEYPVTDLADGPFTQAGLDDGTSPCDRMSISLNKINETSFAHIVGVDQLETHVRAVVRGSPSTSAQGVSALLLLEREGCGTLQRSGQGKVIVKAVQDTSTSAWRAGLIQSDSAGSTMSFGNALTCTTNENSGGYTIYAACTGSNLPGIVAENTPNGEQVIPQGTIATYALDPTVAGRGASCYSAYGPTGLNVNPSATEFTSRKPADDRFNPLGRPAITNLHAGGYATTVTAGASTSGTVLAASTDCSPADGAIFNQVGTITFACGTSGFTVANNRTVTIPNATAVKFIGGVTVAGSLDVASATTVTIGRAAGTSAAASNTARLIVTGIASFGRARAVYVGGTPSACTQDNNCSAVSVSGNGSALRINTGAIGTSSCAPGPGAGGSATNWTQLATFGGAVDVAGSMSACQTMVYVGRSQVAYAADQRVDGGLNCSFPKPCPALSTTNSRDRFRLNGGNSAIIWSAPNQTTTDPNATNPFEGLALWTEGTGISQIKGTGTMVTTGVFLLPNALFQFDGQASSSNPYNAQFWTRTLSFSGQGDLNLAPNPQDSIKTPTPGGFALIR